MSVDVIAGEIWDRNDFGLLCEYRLLNRCAEIGVDRGEFSNAFLSRHRNCTLYLAVDDYSRYPERLWSRDADKDMATLRLERFARVAQLLPCTSYNAVEYLKASTSKLYNQSLDFCYIDAAHDKQSVSRDLDLWWPLLSERGILAGHDWAMESNAHPEVQEAVREFAQHHGLTIHVTWRDDPQSWWVYKDKSVHPYSGRSGVTDETETDRT